MNRTRWRRQFMGKSLPYVILAVLGILFFIPLLWMIFSAFDAAPNLTISFPHQLTMKNFVSVLSNASVDRSFVNGVFLSLVSSALLVVVSGLAAYPLSRYQLRFKKPLIFTILFMSGLPITAVMVPVFQLFIFLHFQDSLVATMFFLTAAGLPYGIWMMKNFMDSVPVDLEESAWIDGANVWQGIQKVVAPLMLPGIFTVGIFTFTGSWGNFFVPYILIQSPSKLPASVEIYQFFGQHGLVEYGKLAAFSMVYTIPVVILYILGQRYMSKGFSFGGASKG